MKHATIAALAVVLAAAPAAAQQTQADVHADYQYGTSTHLNGWGAGAAVQETFGGSSAPAKLGLSLGPDYIKQERTGTTSTSVSFDATLQPGGNASVTPYAGGSVSANWSGGDQKMFDGARFGTEAVGGVQVKLGPLSGLQAKAEERFGYVNGQEHTLTTRLGVVFSF